MGREPTGFQRAENREEFRRILILCENSTNIYSKATGTTAAQRQAITHLLQSLVRASRLMLDELDRQDPCAVDELDIDFDLDLRLMLEAEQDKDGSL
jgi:hypothetical protein